jgi:ABC-type nitrate/sulfonate/bicarbonate transport system permease component
LRIAAGIALVVAVTVEIVLNPRGLGYALVLAQQSLKTDVMYAQLLWLCILGAALNAVLRGFGGGQLVSWRPAQ